MIFAYRDQLKSHRFGWQLPKSTEPKDAQQQNPKSTTVIQIYKHLILVNEKQTDLTSMISLI